MRILVPLIPLAFFIFVIGLVNATDWQVEAGRMVNKDRITYKECKYRVSELSDKMIRAGQDHWIVYGTRCLENHCWIELPDGQIIEPSFWGDSPDLYREMGRMLILGRKNEADKGTCSRCSRGGNCVVSPR